MDGVAYDTPFILKEKGERKITVAVHMTTKHLSLSVCPPVCLSVSCLRLSVCLPLFSVSVCLSVSFLSLFFVSIFPVSIFLSLLCLCHFSVSVYPFFCPCLCLSLVFLSLSVSISCLCVCLLVSLLSHTVALMCCLYVTYCLRCRSHIFVPVTTLFCPSCHYNYTEMYLLFSLSLPFTSLPKMSVVRPSMNKTRVPLTSLIVLSEACFALVSYTC